MASLAPSASIQVRFRGAGVPSRQKSLVVHEKRAGRDPSKIHVNLPIKSANTAIICRDSNRQPMRPEPSLQNCSDVSLISQKQELGRSVCEKNVRTAAAECARTPDRCEESFFWPHLER
jgi:hypothetical protein